LWCENYFFLIFTTLKIKGGFGETIAGFSPYKWRKTCGCNGGIDGYSERKLIGVKLFSLK
jgi:hypothetical protein